MTSENKVAFIFPGQGLAEKDIQSYYHRLRSLDKERIINHYLDLVQESAHKQPGIPFNARSVLEDEIGLAHLHYTSIAQPVVYTLSVLASEISKRRMSEKINPSFVAGHSLGEYAALTQAGVISFEEGIDIVTFRGAMMEDACWMKSSILVSINGLTEEQARKVYKDTSIEVALVNAPTLIVVGAEKNALPEIEKLAKEAGARRVTTLHTEGAFHTSFMQSAADGLGEFLAGYKFEDATIDVVTNITGQPTRNSYALKNHLVEGMVNPVRWANGIQFMKESGVENFVEVGPGTSLASLNTINGIPKEKTKNILDMIA